MLRVRTPSLGDGGGAGAAVNVSASQTLGAVTQSALADVDVAVNVVQTLGAVTQSALADVDVSVQATQTLGAVTQTASISSGLTVSASQTLPSVTQTAALDVDVAVSANQTLGAVTQTATATVAVNASAVQTLSPVTPNLVTNPAFGTDISGWSGYSSTDGTSAALTADATVVSWQAGKLRAASNTGAGHHYAEARQTITGLTVGRDYTFSADYASASAGRGALYLNDGSSVSQQMKFVEGVNDGTGSLSTSWVATQTSVTVVLNNVRFTSGYTDFDNVVFALTSTQIAAVDVDVAVSAAQTLPAVTQTTTVQVVPAGTVISAAQTLGAVTQTATLGVRVGVSVAQTLPAVTQTATVGVRVAASAVQTLGAVTQTVTVDHAAVLPVLTLAVSQTLPAVTNALFVQAVQPGRRLANFARSGFVRGRRDGMKPGFDGDYGRRVATAKTSIYAYEYEELRTRTPGSRG